MSKLRFGKKSKRHGSKIVKHLAKEVAATVGVPAIETPGLTGTDADLRESHFGGVGGSVEVDAQSGDANRVASWAQMNRSGIFMVTKEDIEALMNAHLMEDPSLGGGPDKLPMTEFLEAWGRFPPGLCYLTQKIEIDGDKRTLIYPSFMSERSASPAACNLYEGAWIQTGEKEAKRFLVDIFPSNGKFTVCVLKK